MSTRLDGLLDPTGERPGSATSAAFLSIVAGFVMLVGCAVVLTVLFDSTTASWFFPLVSMVAVSQVSATVLLIAGGVRLSLGAGRTMLVAGNSLHVLLCALYVLYALTVVANNSADSPATAVAMAITPCVLAAVPVASLIMALRPTTTEYLTFRGHAG